MMGRGEGHGTEVRGDGIEVRGDGTEVRGDGTEVRGDGTEVRLPWGSESLHWVLGGFRDGEINTLNSCPATLKTCYSYHFTNNNAGIG